MAAVIVVLTGAGISADSGVATFRDGGGLWEGRRPEEVATPSAWARDRTAVWRFYQQRRAQLQTVEPNPAHRALADFSASCSERGAELVLVTQNVDDLHERAGSTAIHMHGELLRLRCERCGHTQNNAIDTDPDRFVACPDCHHDALRPDVVWFGETPFHMARIERALLACSHFVAIGTSGNVYPAAGMLDIARQRGARTLVQALEPPTNLDAVDAFYPGRAKDEVPRLTHQILDDL
jgi:NAD-dependent deacetylase